MRKERKGRERMEKGAREMRFDSMLPRETILDGNRSFFPFFFSNRCILVSKESSCFSILLFSAYGSRSRIPNATVTWFARVFHFSCVPYSSLVGSSRRDFFEEKRL